MDDGSEMTTQDHFGVIMAGGKGTRFWPVSTSSKPKQFLELFGGASMLQLTASRLEKICPRDRILVVTGGKYSELVRDQMPWLPRENLLQEPSGRNTAACIGWAASVLSERGYGDSVMSVVASDHMIEPLSGFVTTMASAADLALEGWLVTIGIRPNRPATGYGYLEAGCPLGNKSWEVSRFVEKPDAVSAALYLDTGRYFWNSGMFIWKTDRILAELGMHLPDLRSGLDQLASTTEPPPGSYDTLPSISIDCGVMEKADRVAMVEALFDWDDIGDWPGSRRAGVRRGEVISADSHDCTVWSDGDRLTVLMGVENLSVVQTDRVTLVMSDDQSQALRDLVRKIEEERPDLA
jgi:mannose-1-phosphate guanylyltransferase